MTIDSIPSANPRRGLRNEHLAVQFAQQHPVGSVMTMDDFDQWCQAAGLLVLPMPPVVKKSDAWLAHLQRRHQAREGLNRALVHPRMTAIGMEPCKIERIAHLRLEVRNVRDLILHNRMAKAVSSLTGTHRKQLQYAMQSADWQTLPAYERVRIEMLYFDIEGFGESTEYAAGQLKRKMQQVIEAMNHAVASGAITASNTVAQALTAPIPDDDSDDTTDDTGDDD
jgi:hypothetical protein